MHRLHHQYSDQEKDPHSPVNHGVFGTLPSQVKSYERIMKGLILRRKEYTSVIKDLDFDISWVIRSHFWWAPYLMHLAIAILVGFFCHGWWIGIAYWVGIMSHPIQGWMVNSLAHQYGYRNFKTDDHSTNNTLVAWLILGEGYQNNHHQDPTSAKFSYRWFEFDLGYLLCLVAQSLGMLEIPRLSAKHLQI